MRTEDTFMLLVREIKNLIENYYQQKMIDPLEKEWLLGQLNGIYEEKDPDLLF